MTAQLVSNSTGILNLSDDGKVSLSGTNASFTLPNYVTGSLPSGNEGDIVFDTSNLDVMVYTGSAWEPVSDPIHKQMIVFTGNDTIANDVTAREIYAVLVAGSSPNFFVANPSVPGNQGTGTFTAGAGYIRISFSA